MASGPSSASSTAPYGWMGSLLGGLAGAYGSTSAAGQTAAGENNAIGTETQLQGTLGGIYGQELNSGNAAFSGLSSALGLNGGTPNYSAFDNSPGFQYSVDLANQATDRQAAAAGSLYAPNTLDAVSANTVGLASQNYNNYISQLLQTAGYGASGNASYAGNMTSAANNIAQAQIGKGVASGAGTAGAAGALGTTAQSLPWGQIISGIGSLFNGSTNNSGMGSPSSGLSGNLGNTDYSNLGTLSGLGGFGTGNTVSSSSFNNMNSGFNASDYNSSGF